MGKYRMGVVLRALGAGALALGSKAAVVIKGGGGLSGLAKGAGMLAVGGGAAAAVSTRTGQQQTGEQRSEPPAYRNRA